MNASEIYELVKDVDRKWWPKDIVGYVPECYFMLKGSTTKVDRAHAEDVYLSDETAELLFEASFTRTLIGEGFHTFDWSSDVDSETVTLTLYHDEFVVPDRGGCLAALAAAVKSIAANASKECGA